MIFYFLWDDSKKKKKIQFHRFKSDFKIKLNRWTFNSNESLMICKLPLSTWNFPSNQAFILLKEASKLKIIIKSSIDSPPTKRNHPPGEQNSHSNLFVLVVIMWSNQQFASCTGNLSPTQTHFFGSHFPRCIWLVENCISLYLTSEQPAAPSSSSSLSSHAEHDLSHCFFAFFKLKPTHSSPSFCPPASQERRLLLIILSFFFCWLVGWLVGRSDTFHRIFRPATTTSCEGMSGGGKVFQFSKEAGRRREWMRCLCLCYVGAR